VKIGSASGWWMKSDARNVPPMASSRLARMIVPGVVRTPDCAISRDSHVPAAVLATSLSMPGSGPAF